MTHEQPAPESRIRAWSPVVRIGLIGGVIAVYLCLVGIVPTFNERPLIAGVISLGEASLLLAWTRRRLPGGPPGPGEAPARRRWPPGRWREAWPGRWLTLLVLVGSVVDLRQCLHPRLAGAVRHPDVRPRRGRLLDPDRRRGAGRRHRRGCRRPPRLPAPAAHLGVHRRRGHGAVRRPAPNADAHEPPGRPRPVPVRPGWPHRGGGRPGLRRRRRGRRDPRAADHPPAVRRPPGPDTEGAPGAGAPRHDGRRPLVPDRLRLVLRPGGRDRRHLRPDGLRDEHHPRPGRPARPRVRRVLRGRRLHRRPADLHRRVRARRLVVVGGGALRRPLRDGVRGLPRPADPAASAGTTSPSPRSASARSSGSSPDRTC